MKRSNHPKAALIISIIACSNYLAGCGDSTTKEERLQNATGFYEKNEYQSSIIELKNVLQSDQHNKQARLLLGKIYLEQGAYANAEKELSRAYRLQKSNDKSFKLYTKALLKLESYDELTALLAEQNKIPKTDIREEIALVTQLLMLIQQSDEEKAKALITSDAFESLQSDDAIYARAKFYNRDGQSNVATDIVKQLLTINPTHIEGLILQGNILFFNDKVEEALTHYNQAAAIRSQDPNIQIKVVQALVSLKQYQEASNILIPMLKQFPLFHQANYYFAYIQLLDKKYHESLLYAKKVIELIPNHNESIYIAAQASFYTEEYESSYRWANKLAQRFPNQPPILKLLAATQLKLDLNQDAIETLSLLEQSDIFERDSGLFLTAAQKHTNNDKNISKRDLLLIADKLKPNSSQSKWELAQIEFFKGNHSQGNQYLNAALKNAPKSIPLMAALTTSYITQGELTKAKSLILKMLENDKNNPNTYTLQAFIYLKEDKIELAKENLNKALAIEANNPNANDTLARIAIQDGDFKRAKALYEKILISYPNDIKTISKLWKISQHQGNQVEAFSWLNQAYSKAPNNISLNIALAEAHILKKEYDSAIDLLKTQTTKHKNNNELKLLLAQSYFYKQDFESALKQFIAVNQSAPDNILSYVFTALTLEQLQRFVDANSYIKKATFLNPNDPLIKAISLRLALISNDLVLAEEILGQLLKLEPDNVILKEQQADLALKKNNNKQAVILYKALHSEHTTNFTLAKYAIALVRNKQHDEAIEVLEHWLTQYPTDSLILNLLANEYLALDEQQKARPLFEKIIASNPKNSLAQNNLAWLLHTSGNSTKALIHAEMAYKTAPLLPQINDTLGQILIVQGDYQRAVEVLKYANKKMPQNLETKYQLANANALIGDATAARKMLQQILTKTRSGEASDNNLRDRTRSLLKKLNN